jgi:hypothetical protein
MTNKTTIKGNKNVSISDVKNSKVSIGNKSSFKPDGKFLVIAGVTIALIALVLQVVVGWDEIIKWIYAK